MTGAAVLWCWIAIFFAIPLVVVLICVAIKAINEDLPSWKGFLAAMFICVISATGTIFSGFQCQKAYDINFSVAMKNINYTRTTEVNTQIEMDYHDVASDNPQK